jgi:hypothetical protein
MRFDTVSLVPPLFPLVVKVLPSLVSPFALLT